MIRPALSAWTARYTYRVWGARVWMERRGFRTLRHGWDDKEGTADDALRREETAGATRATAVGPQEGGSGRIANESRDRGISARNRGATERARFRASDAPADS